MGLFDVFSGQDAQNAANSQTQGYANGIGALAPAITTGTNFLENQGTAANNAATTNYAAGLQPFQQNNANASQATTQLLAALGLGPQGAAGMANTFENTPGYQFTLDQGAQNVLRNQEATGGSVNNGATQLALQKQGQGTAQQYYQNYIQQLLPFLQYGTANAQGTGNLFSGLGSLLSGNNMAVGQGVNANQGILGSAGYGANVGAGNAQAQADYSQLNASQNLWNLFGNVAGAGVKAAATRG